MNPPHHPPASLDRRRILGQTGAFTLIELLTVIAIIGVLAAIIIPVAGQMREASKSSRCVTNLRQVGVAIQTYANDNKGSLPATGFFGVSPYYNRDPRNFQNSLLTYLDLKESSSWSTAVASSNYSPVFDCIAYKGDLGGKGYTLNNNIPDVNGTTVKPWGTITNAQGSISPKPQKLTVMSAKEWAMRDNDSTEGGNHHGYQNRIYFDWHVERIAVNN